VLRTLKNGQTSTYVVIYTKDKSQIETDKAVVFIPYKPSPAPVEQGATWSLVFLMSKDVKPNEMNFVYSYKGEPPKPKQKKWGKIAVNLSEKIREDTELLIKVKVTKAIIRLNPEAESEVVAKVPLGTTFAPEKKVGEWYQVSFCDKRGFVLSGYIHESNVMLLWR